MSTRKNPGFRFKDLKEPPQELVDAVFQACHQQLPPVTEPIGQHARRMLLVVMARRNHVRGASVAGVATEIDNIATAIAKVLALLLPDAGAVKTEFEAAVREVDRVMSAGEQIDMSPVHVRPDRSPDPVTPQQHPQPQQPQQQAPLSPDLSSIIRESVSAAVSAMLASGQGYSHPQQLFPNSSAGPNTTGTDGLTEELARTRRTNEKRETSYGPLAMDNLTAEEEEALRDLPLYTWRRDDPDLGSIRRSIVHLARARIQLRTTPISTFIERMSVKLMALSRCLLPSQTAELQLIVMSSDRDVTSGWLGSVTALVEMSVLTERTTPMFMVDRLRHARISPNASSAAEAKDWITGKQEIPVDATLPPTRAKQSKN